MGITIPDMPNLFTFIGPSWPIENGAVVGPLSHDCQYAIQVMQRMQSEYIASLTPRQDVTDDFNAHVQEWVRHTVWADDCRSWYKDNDTGRVNAIWPGSSLHYIEAIRQPRYEDYEIRYMGPARKNRWAYLGMGTTRESVEVGSDLSPYLTLDAMDAAWARANKVDGRRILEERVDKVKRAWEDEFGCESDEGEDEERWRPNKKVKVDGEEGQRVDVESS
jgi:hydroxyversicolorone monooxygenase